MSLLNKLSKKTEATKETSVVAKKKTAPKKTATKNVSETGARGHAFRVLIKPLLSEKAAILESQSAYVFVVAMRATKEDIKRAIIQLYGETPVQIRTSVYEGKHVRFANQLGRRRDWKKAIVTFKKGTTIAVHQGV